MGAFGSILRRDPNSTPKEPIPVVHPTRADLEPDSATGLRAIWLGHSTVYLEVTCTPARHASGRTLFDKDRTLWGGFAFRGPVHRVYYSGDTGMFPGLADIGSRLGPFDLTMIEAGAYGPAWPDWHLGPEQAVQAHGMVQGKVLLPVHWGLFDLAAHGWTEPIERVLVAARAVGATVAVPRPGESIEPATGSGITRWWPTLPWKTGTEVPIQATPDGLKPQTVPGGAS